MWKTILSIFLAVQLSAEVVNLDKFGEGLETRRSAILISKKGTPDCQNVLFDEVGGITRRNGYRYKGYADVDTVGQRLFPYKRSSGAKYLYKQINASLYKTISGDDDSWTSVRSDIRYQQNFLDSAIIENLLFLANGIDNVFSVDGGSSYEEYDFIKKGKYITSMSEGTSGVLYDRGFVANTYDFASGVYWSDVAYSITDSNAWSESQIFLVGGNDGEVITALYVWRGDLYIFKERSVWRLTGNDPSNWVLRRLTREYGCFGQDTIQEKDNILIFVSKDRKAVVGFDGSFFKELSKPIEPDLENWDNFEGYYNYWIQSTSDDFIAGTSTGNEVGADIVLEDLTKIWNSSVTFSTTTILGSSSTFSNITINPSSLELASTATASGTSITISPSYSVKTRRSDSSQNFTSMWNFWTNELYDTWGSIPSPFYKDSGYNEVDGNNNTFIELLEDKNEDLYRLGATISDNTNVSQMELRNFITECSFGETYSIGSFSMKFNYAIYNVWDVTTYPQLELVVRARYNNEWVVVYEKEIYKNTIVGLGKEKGVVNLADETVNFNNPIFADTIEINLVLGTQKGELDVNNNGQKYYQIDKIFEIELTGGTSLGGTLHDSTGTYTTEIYDEGYQVYGGTFTVSLKDNDYEVKGTTVSFQIRTSSWSATMSGSTYTYLNGDVEGGVKIPTWMSPFQYVQVIASFTTTQSSHTATLQSISVGTTKSTSSFQTTNFQVDEITGWKYFISDDTTPNDTGISYAIRTSSSEAGLSSATWDWIESGDLLDSGRHTSTHTWIVAKATSSTTDGTRRPEIHSLTFTWYPESEPIRLTSKIVDKRYWLGVSTYTGYNDNIYVLDKNMKWTRFSGYTPADIANWKGLTYILDASSSAIWEADYGNADRWESATASCTIVSYWTSKALFLALDRESSIEYIYSSLKATGGDLTVGYAMYGDSYSEFDIDLSGSGEVNDRARITTGETWKVWSFKFSDTSTVDPWEIHNVGVYFVPKPLR